MAKHSVIVALTLHFRMEARGTMSPEELEAMAKREAMEIVPRHWIAKAKVKKLTRIHIGAEEV